MTQADWLRLTAPGTLLTRSIVLGALIGAPAVTAYVAIDPTVRVLAGGLLLVHAAGVLSLRRGDWWCMIVSILLLACDGMLCGALVHGLPELRGPGLPLISVVLALGFQTAGWSSTLGSFGAVVAGVAGAAWLRIDAPLMLSPRLVFPTTLSVETLFAGLPAVTTAMPILPTALSVDPSFAKALAVATPVYWLPTTLAVETHFGGVPALGSVSGLFVPAVVIAVLAVGVGGGLNLRQTRRAVHRSAKPDG